MRINTKIKDDGQLYLTVYSADQETTITTPISNCVHNKVERKTENELHNLVIEAGRYNDWSDIEIVRFFVENTLTEREIRELIKLLEN